MNITINGVILDIRYNMASLEALMLFGGSESESNSTYRVVWAGVVGGLVGSKYFITNSEVTIEGVKITIHDIIEYVDNLYLTDQSDILKNFTSAFTESNVYKAIVEKKSQMKKK